MEVIATDEMIEWYQSLPEREARTVNRYVEMLEISGVNLGYPYASGIQGSRYAFRELRAATGRSELRVIYAFDPRRDAVLLIGGNKTGDGRFYEWIIPWAEQIWENYLSETGQD